MFYSQYVLTKKGPLAKIWLAAHMQSKLTKAMVFAVDVCKAVDNILTPAAPMALRLSSNLLLGVSRINSRKAKYLLQDSMEAMTKLKITYVSGAVINLDLPANENHANFNSITLDNTAPSGNITMNISSSRTPLLDLDLLPRGNGSTKRSIDRSTTNTNSFLAAERDITIDEFAGGLTIGSMNDAFALDPELFRERDETLGGNEPLLFTPRRTPSKSASHSPAIASVLSIPRSTGSMEVMRAGTPTAGGPVGTPRLSMGTPLGTPARPGQDSPEITRSAAIDPNVVGTPKLGERSASEIEIPRDADDNIPLPEDADMALDDSVQAPAPPIGDEEGDVGDLARVSMGEGEGRLSLGGDDDLMLDEGGGTGDSRSGRGTPLPVARIDAPTPHVTQGGEDEIEEQAETVSQPTTQRGRKRRHVSRIDTEQTEITAAQFRDCLNDTSDLIRRPRAKRKTAKADTIADEEPETAEEMLAKPAIDMPDEINVLFQEMFGPDELLQRVASPLSERDGDQERKASPSPGPEDVESMRQSPSVSVGGAPSGSPTVSVGAQAEFLPPQMEMVEPEIPLPEDTPVPLPEDSPVPMPEEPVDLPIIPDEPVEPVPLPEGLEIRDEDTAAPAGTLKEVAFTRVEVDGEESERLTKRALKMREYVAENFTEETNKFNLNESLRNEARMTRRVAARSFYEVLNLCSHRLVKVEQDTPYGDVLVSAVQPAFDQAASAVAQ